MQYNENQVKELASRVVKTFDKRGYKCTQVGNYRSWSGITIYFEKGGVTEIGVTVTNEGKYRYEGTRRSSDGTNNLYIVLERTDEYVNRQVSRNAERKKNEETSAKIQAEIIKQFGAPTNPEDISTSYGECEIKYGLVTVEGKINDKNEIVFNLNINTKYDSLKATPEQIKQVIAIFNQIKAQ